MKSDLAVIDTNILVSSLIGLTGYSRKIFDDLITTGKIKICVSVAVFDEYTEVLQRDRFKKYPAFSDASTILLDQIKKNGFWYEPKLTIDVLADKDDNKFSDCAFASNVHYLVTNDKHFNVLKSISFPSINILSLEEFKNLLS